MHEDAHKFEVGDGDVAGRVGGRAEFVSNVVWPRDVPHKWFEWIGSSEPDAADSPLGSVDESLVGWFLFDEFVNVGEAISH